MNNFLCPRSSGKGKDERSWQDWERFSGELELELNKKGEVVLAVLGFLMGTYASVGSQSE